MTTVVTAHCNFCHTDLKIKPEAVGLYTYSVKHKQFTDYYAFFCVHCREYNRKDADNHVVDLLVSGGVVLRVVTVPLEVIERMGSKAPPMNLDDVLNLVMYLRDHDYLPEPVPARRFKGASRPQGAP